MSEPADWWRAHRTLLAVGALAVLVSFVVRLATLDQPLVEAHSFRQTQTAYTAVVYHREGINLLQTPLPVLGPPWVVPYEFPLFQGFAAVVMELGVRPEIALRATSLAFFVVASVLVWLIVSLELGTRTATLAVGAFALAPLGLLWSRSSMIETIAVAVALGSVLEALRWDRSGSRVHFAAAVALGVLAALLKITTAMIWLAPALLLLRRHRAAALALVSIVGLAGIAWSAYADAIKDGTPATAFLTSAALRDWNFGTFAQRLDPTTWITCLGWLAGLGFVAIAAPATTDRSSRLAIWSMATLLLGPLVFTNLYVVHDYYWMAVAPAVAILTGVVVSAFLAQPARRGRRLILVTVLFALSFVAYPRWTLMLGDADPDGVLRMAADVRGASDPDDLVAISNGDWSPAILFYAERRGYMEFDSVPPAPPGYVHFTCPRAGAAGRCIRQ